LTFAAKEGGHEGHFTYKAAADGYVTIVMEQSPAGSITFTPIVDQAEFNQTRARLAFYNAAPGCASATLGLDPSGPAVFQDVASGATKSRTVNPVQATVRASCAGQPGPTLALGGMDLGASYSIWLMQPDGKPILFMTPDVSAKYKPRS
jgi:alginate O-acetyltransferase complex protein AlgF